MELVETSGYACMPCGRAWARRPNTSAARAGEKQSIICADCRRTTKTCALITSVKCGRCGFVWTPSMRKTEEKGWVRCRMCNTVFLPTAAEMRRLRRAFLPDANKYMRIVGRIKPG